ncbi:MAG: cytochrome b/b6 domain-containing protein [Peptococcaceae bacterium]|nr:cytochrome b/b6 domain-containing protein [Peptococcaceae bacterium]
MRGKKPRHSGTARLLHWLYAPAVLGSALSGFYIHWPGSSLGFRKMNTARETHFFAQFTLLFTYIARVMYGLKGKNYREILPNRKTLSDMAKFLKYEFYLTDKEPKFPKYNPGQKVLFTGMVLFVLIQIITGLSLYFPKSWQKTAKLVGGLNPLRKLHFLSALTISILVTGHLYFVFTHEYKKMKSIFTGYE